jgi:hypothetical protein
LRHGRANALWCDDGGVASASDGMCVTARMTDDQASPLKKSGADVKGSRRDRLKSALRENLKRRKSQMRGRDAASSELIDAALDDGGEAKPDK